MGKVTTYTEPDKQGIFDEATHFLMTQGTSVPLYDGEFSTDSPVMGAPFLLARVLIIIIPGILLKSWLLIWAKILNYPKLLIGMVMNIMLIQYMYIRFRVQIMRILYR